MPREEVKREKDDRSRRCIRTEKIWFVHGAERRRDITHILADGHTERSAKSLMRQVAKDSVDRFNHGNGQK